MPDVFTGLLVIALFLLTIAPECLRRRKRQQLRNGRSSAQTVAGATCALITAEAAYLTNHEVAQPAVCSLIAACLAPDHVNRQ
jgi:hypothetical protein